MHNKKILIITYYFPPSGGAGVQRCLKFVKYLSEFGWQPVVLTVKDADYPAYDESLFAEVPENVPVYRTKIFEPYQLYRRLTGKKVGEAMDIATLSRDSSQQRKWSERLAEFIRSTLFIPDARIGWKPFAVREGLEIIQKEKIDLILSSAPPYTCHLIGRALKLKTELPWICDFRDSWVGWLSAAKRSGLPHWIELRQEQAVLRDADRILTVSPGVQEDLTSRHPKLLDQRWLQLPNGYDSHDFEGIEPFPEDNKLTITYTGSLYGNRNPENLLKALIELIHEDLRWKTHLRLKFVGRVAQPILEQFNQPELTGLIEYLPYVPHQESIRHLLSTDLALLIIDDAPANKGILTGKLYEYLGSHKPILALAPPGNAVDLIRQLKAGFLAPPGDIEQIKAILREIMDKWLNRQLTLEKIDQTGITNLDRKNLTKQLGQIADELLSQQKS
jgi:glycosyltransferase involved in cell wall biosynthesis